MSEDDFKESLARLVLDVPLSIRAPAAGWLVRASTHGATMDKVLQGGLRKSYGRWCLAHEGPGDCLSLLEDGLGFTSEDKLALALGLSLDPMRESIAEAVEDTLNPHFFTTVVVSALVSWAVLAANPEPVFTKGAAILAAVLVVYLGVDSFLEVVRACSELKSLTDRATTFQELEEAGARFGRVLGQEGARIFLLAATALVSKGTAGSASWMTSRLPLLPRFTEATALGASQVGLRLDAVGQVSAVAVVEESFAMVLAPGAVAMAATSPRSRGASALTHFRSWGSHSGLKKALGPAGQGKQWHHIVEQTKGNVGRFGKHVIHNTHNVIALNEGLHVKISGYYSSIQRFTAGKTVRHWLSTQSFDAQRDFGLKTLRDFGATP
ncbi:hypothetical protein [Pyxidicoccus trucidator]|uniref:SitA5 family polymorphic toxin n=1 Tax=Pyxidicoccus trucidator TaxID=2709662 RepID=UPI001F07F968|nr:hypothetical protein [Pyxidicoccus trucidator]